MKRIYITAMLVIIAIMIVMSTTSMVLDYKSGDLGWVVLDILACGSAAGITAWGFGSQIESLEEE